MDKCKIEIKGEFIKDNKMMLDLRIEGQEWLIADTLANAINNIRDSKPKIYNRFVQLDAINLEKHIKEKENARK